ncbi:disease resistance protein RUN1-like [Cornus florida]|uniref:disease resistance protein RUN1-like n=1 Tax=Cornus florida TaxID=4283 RepID=UPI0028A0E22D|nr:disease resistance protein RUN1-like [Cornus florida]
MCCNLDRNEAAYIQRLVDYISSTLQCKTFKVAEHEVGIDSRANKLIMKLNEERSEERLFLGIYGKGGIGKTTLAKAVYKRIANEFDCSCFLESVRERSNQPDGMAKVQIKHLRETLMDNKINSDLVVTEIKNRLGNKRVLIILDDVNHEKQLASLVGIPYNWFGPGSKIIITTGYKCLLEKNNGKTFDIEALNDREALELFSWHAFRRSEPVEEYKELSQRAKDYANGLPLALEVLGSCVRQRSKPEWLSIFDRLKTTLPIHEVLKLRYDGLDKKEQNMLLDLACFFKGYDKDHVGEIYCGVLKYDPIFGMQVLNESCLINTSKDNKLLIHESIQEMGREIVCQESEEPGKHSRVTENIQSIVFDGKGTFHVSAHDFEKVKKLKFLKISGVLLDRCPASLSNQLPYLEWNGYSQKYLPRNFHPKNLVQLRLPHSQLKQIFMDKKVHPSIAFHQSLVSLDLRKCENLRRLPERVNLISLRSLDLSGCSKFKKFPEIQGPMDCLEQLFLDGTAIEDIPPSVKHLKGLQVLNLKDCKKLESLPSEIGEMKSLEVLWLGGSEVITGQQQLSGLPPSFTQLTNLQRLYLDGCLSLKTVKSLPSSIRFVRARGCVSFEQYSIPTSEGSPDDRRWIFTDCVKLGKNHGNKPYMYSKSQLMYMFLRNHSDSL